MGPIPFRMIVHCHVQKRVRERTGRIVIPTIPATAWGGPEGERGCIGHGVAVTSSLADSAQLAWQPALGSPLLSEPQPWSLPFPSFHGEDGRRRSRDPPVGSLVTFPVSSHPRLFTEGSCWPHDGAYVSRESLLWQGKKKKRRACVRPLRPGRSGGSLGSRASGFLFVFSLCDSGRVRWPGCFSGTNVLSALMLCQAARSSFASLFLFACLFFRLGGSPGLRYPHRPPGLRGPSPASLAGGLRARLPLPSAQESAHQHPSGLSTWLDDSSANTARPPECDSHPLSPRLASLSGLTLARAPGIRLPSFPPLGQNLLLQHDWGDC